MPKFRTLELSICLMLLTGCGGDRSGKEATEPGELLARVTSRFPLRTIGLDTLSDSARIVRLFPEPGGGAVAFTFTDPLQGISRGLGILSQTRDSAPRLGWPDSVSSVHWRDSHRLVFTAGTGNGVYVILDVRADSLVAVRDTASPATGDSSTLTAREATPEIRARITRMIDSIRFQPEGVPQQGQLRYSPTRILPSPHDSSAAFYVSASDGSGNTSNPTWYLLDLASGAITPLDSVIGPAQSLPGDTGVWANDSTFYFTKELTLYEVRVQREDSGSN